MKRTCANLVVRRIQDGVQYKDKILDNCFNDMPNSFVDKQCPESSEKSLTRMAHHRNPLKFYIFLVFESDDDIQMLQRN